MKTNIKTVFQNSLEHCIKPCIWNIFCSFYFNFSSWCRKSAAKFLVFLTNFHVKIIGSTLKKWLKIFIIAYTSHSLLWWKKKLKKISNQLFPNTIKISLEMVKNCSFYPHIHTKITTIFARGILCLFFWKLTWHFPWKNITSFAIIMQ